MILIKRLLKATLPRWWLVAGKNALPLKFRHRSHSAAKIASLLTSCHSMLYQIMVCHIMSFHASKIPSLVSSPAIS